MTKYLVNCININMYKNQMIQKKGTYLWISNVFSIAYMCNLLVVLFDKISVNGKSVLQNYSKCVLWRHQYITFTDIGWISFTTIYFNSYTINTHGINLRTKKSHDKKLGKLNTKQHNSHFCTSRLKKISRTVPTLSILYPLTTY
jgi:hypothetical protein